MGNNVRSVFAWIYLTSNPLAVYSTIYSYGGVTGVSYSGASFRVQNVAGNGNVLIFGTGNGNSWTGTFAPPLNTWDFVGYVYSAGGASTITYYLNGQSQTGVMALGAINTELPSTFPSVIGATSGTSQFLPGMISDLQVYNSVVTPAQEAQLYAEGIDGQPLGSNNLVAWWPLDGNVNDYSSMGNNGVANSVSFKFLSGYSGDPVYDGSSYNGNQTNIIEGVSGCSNINQCSNSSLQQLYLGRGSLSSVSGLALPEAAGLGLLSPTSAGQFNGQGSYIGVGNPTSLQLQYFTAVAWVRTEGYPNSGFVFSHAPQCSSGWGLYESGGVWSFDNACVVGIASAPSQNNKGTWTQVGVFRASNNLAGIIINGNFVGTTTYSATFGFGNLNIGDRGGALPFDGEITNFQIYSAGLTQQQLSALYAEGIGGAPLASAGNVGWWPLNGNANDYSGNGNNGAATSVSYAPVGASAVIPDVTSLSGGYVNQSVPYGWMGTAAQPFSLSIWINPNSLNGVIVDETGPPGSGWHDSWLELVGGTLYMRMWNLPCVSLGAVPLNKWSSITMTYDGSSTYRGYVNGVLANSGTGARTGPGGGTLMYYPLGLADTTNCGSGVAYAGSMADYQFYNAQLGAPQVSQLYQNDSVIGVNAMDRWPLSYGYNGLMNRTSDTANAPDFDLFYNKYGACSDVNVVTGYCGVGIAPP